METYSFLNPDEAVAQLNSLGIQAHNVKAEFLTLEDAFIGLTGKY